MNDMGKNRRLTDLTQKLAESARMLTSAGMASAGSTVSRDGNDGRGAVEAIVGGVAVVSNALSTLASFLNSGNDVNGPVSSDEMLFTALLVWHCSPSNDGEKSVLAFDPSLIHDAMESFKKMTGRKPDSFMIPAMAQAARDCAREGNVPLAEWRRRRAVEIAAEERGNNPLN